MVHAHERPDIGCFEDGKENLPGIIGNFLFATFFDVGEFFFADAGHVFGIILEPEIPKNGPHNTEATEDIEHIPPAPEGHDVEGDKGCDGGSDPTGDPNEGLCPTGFLFRKPSIYDDGGVRVGASFS